MRLAVLGLFLSLGLAAHGARAQGAEHPRDLAVPAALANAPPGNAVQDDASAAPTAAAAAERAASPVASAALHDDDVLISLVAGGANVVGMAGLLTVGWLGIGLFGPASLLIPIIGVPVFVAGSTYLTAMLMGDGNALAHTGGALAGHYVGLAAGLLGGFGVGYVTGGLMGGNAGGDFGGAFSALLFGGLGAAVGAGLGGTVGTIVGSGVAGRLERDE